MNEKLKYLAPLVIFAVGLALYAPTLGYPFFFDDFRIIVEAPRIHSLANFWPPSGARYIGDLSFALNYALGGAEPGPFRLVNVLIHSATSALVFYLVILTFRTPALESVDKELGTKAALLASFVFLVHPVQTQAVTYIVQRYTSLAAMFYVLAVALYARARLAEGGARGAFLAGSFAATLLAMGSKQNAVTLPVMVVLYEFFFFPGEGFIKRFKKLSWYFVPLLLTMALVPLALLAAGKAGALGEMTRETTSLTRGEYFFTQLRVIVTYIRLLVLPVNQNLDYDYHLYRSPFAPEVLASGAFLLCLVGLAVYLFMLSRKRGEGRFLVISFGIFWFFIALSVESSFIPIRDLIFEHRVYLPAVGPLAALSTLAVWVFSRFDIQRYLLPAGLVVVVVFSAATVKRNQVWSDPVALWKDVVAKSPGKPRPHYNLGYEYHKRGELEKAARKYIDAIRINPAEYEAHSNLGVIYASRGNYRAAIRELKAALEVKPDYADAINNLGTVYFDMGLYREAVRQYEKLVGIDPRFVDGHVNLAIAYESLSNAGAAARHYRRALRLDPGNAKAVQGLRRLGRAP